MFNRSIIALAGTLAFAITLGALFTSLVAARGHGTSAAQPLGTPTPTPQPFATPQPFGTPQPGGISQADVLFVNDFVWSIAGDLARSQIAQQFANRQETRDFAQNVINTDNQILDELTQLASSKGIVLPSEIVNVARSQLTVSQTQVSAANQMFDVFYLNRQVEIQQRNLTLLQFEAANGSDPDLREFAARNQAVVQQQLSSARQAMSTLMGGAGIPLPSTCVPQ
jgi:putative membrane protein